MIEHRARQCCYQSGNDERIRDAATAAIAYGNDCTPDGEQEIAEQIHMGLDGRDKPMRAAIATRICQIGNALKKRAKSPGPQADTRL
jgi:hypothetical protein